MRDYILNPICQWERDFEIHQSGVADLVPGIREIPGVEEK